MSAQLARIIAEGTHVDYRIGEDAAAARKRRADKPSNKITCADGFTLSVVAGGGVYSTPRDGDNGPYTSVEVGYPSSRPEPWADWVEYCESPDRSCDTVYGFVPVALVVALVESHGGAS